MATVSETIQVSGIRCERCVLRLAKTLEGVEGLESANANLMGQVMLSYDDERTSHAVLVQHLAVGGFPPPATGSHGFVPALPPGAGQTFSA